jgi:transcriptional regulator GlxA family with amidase domain
MQPSDIVVDPDRTLRWGILVLPQFPLLAYSAIVDSLRVANAVTGADLYRWATISAAGAFVEASCGTRFRADHLADDAPSVDRILVVSGVQAQEFSSPAALAWIRREMRRGASLGAVSDGAFLLARAGLLEGYRCTVHWVVQSSFREAFPEIDLSRELFVIDRDRFTAAGGVGTLDMMLRIYEMDHGAEIASAVSEWFVHSRIREAGDRELLSIRLRTGVRDERVLKAVAAMEHAIEEPLDARTLASGVGVSIDTLERAFKRELGQSAMQYYRMLRLRRARDLVEGSALRIGEIALACGFSDSSGFARAYRAHFGVSPREHRAPSVG